MFSRVDASRVCELGAQAIYEGKFDLRIIADGIIIIVTIVYLCSFGFQPGLVVSDQSICFDQFIMSLLSCISHVLVEIPCLSNLALIFISVCIFISQTWIHKLYNDNENN